nr:GNAT family N-acetyltransferase [Pseudoalteromonas sp. OANN1]
MGKPFLRLLYHGFLSIETGVLRVVEKDNKIVAFSAGTTSPDTFFSEMKKTKWPSFFLASLYGILKNPLMTFKKLYSALFYKGDTIPSLENAALLSSIAVLPSYIGNSIGAKLLKDYENYIISLNKNNKLYLTTDKNNNERVLRFYQNAGFKADSEFSQSGNRVMYRFVKDLQR